MPGTFVVLFGLAVGALVGRALIVVVCRRIGHPLVVAGLLAAVRALFYSPTLLIMGHGIALMPTVAALVLAWRLAEAEMPLPFLLPAATVFVDSLISSARRGRSSRPKRGVAMPAEPGT